MKSLQKDGRTDDGQKVIGKAHLNRNYANLNSQKITLYWGRINPDDNRPMPREEQSAASQCQNLLILTNIRW